MGSSAPRNSLVFEWEQHRAYMPADTYGAVFGDNLARLLGLQVPQWVKFHTLGTPRGDPA
jgi:hypothetical protein